MKKWNYIILSEKDDMSEKIGKILNEIPVPKYLTTIQYLGSDLLIGNKKYCQTFGCTLDDESRKFYEFELNDAIKDSSFSRLQKENASQISTYLKIMDLICTI